VSRNPARFTQADVARAIRAAKQTGAGAVLILTDGTIRIELTEGAKDEPAGYEAPLARCAELRREPIEGCSVPKAGVPS
jgi:hypothetical protein